MELCFPKDTPSKSSNIMKREVAYDFATTTILPEANTTEEENVTLSVLADVQVEREGQTLFGVSLHSSLPAKHLGFKSKYQRETGSKAQTKWSVLNFCDNFYSTTMTLKLT